jgi:hypothetical protein
MTWAWIIGYIVGYVLTWRKAAYVITMNVCGSLEYTDGLDWIMGAFFAGIAALVWPALVIGWYARRIYYAAGLEVPFATVVFAPPKSVETHRERADRLEHEQAARERRIAELEREVGIR